MNAIASQAPSAVTSHMDWATIVARQGWSDESQLIHALGFIAQQGLMLDFVAYAEKMGREEAAMTKDVEVGDGPHADQEIIGVAEDGRLIFWNAITKSSCVSGDTLESFGAHNITDQEMSRIKAAAPKASD